MGSPVVITPDPVGITPDVPSMASMPGAPPPGDHPPASMLPSINPGEGMVTVPPPGRIPGASMPPPQVTPGEAAGMVGAGGVAGGLGLGATTAVGGAIASGVGTMLKAGVKALPYVAASEGINYARQNLPGGKYIPPGAELLPFFMGGKPGEGPPPSSRAEGQMAEDLPIPAGKIPMPGPRPNGPYSGPNTPQFMEPAQSGSIAKHGYVPQSQTMVTEFKNGKVYDARGVPKEVYDNFRNAESQGSFYAQNIKGRYNTSYRGSVSPTK